MMVPARRASLSSDKSYFVIVSKNYVLEARLCCLKLNIPYDDKLPIKRTGVGILRTIVLQYIVTW